MSEKNQLSEDYISTSGLQHGIKQFLRGFFWFITYLTIVLLKNKYIVIIGLIVGLLLGYLFYKTRPVYYKVSMVVEFNELTKRTYAEMLDQLNNLTGPSSVPRLSKELNIPAEAASKISFIDTRNINDEPLETDSSTRKWQPFKIILGLTNISGTDTLERAVVNYLNNSPMLKKIKLEQRKITLEKLAFVNSDLQKLDSLKIEYNKFLSRPNAATFYNNAFNPADLFVQSSALAREREILMRWLTIDSAAVSVIDGFKASAAPQSISLLKSLLIFGSVGLLLGYLIAFMRETKMKVSGP
jgi:hypothetical protein